ncbi:MAG: sigma-70 family RNA polymerase sigma factor [Thermoanaerobaculia bacterium]|nr:sigma-70 family RNA polymerase sigma factor [Thermoanaerobaculia bacterium]
MSASKVIVAPVSSNPELDLAERHRYGDASAFEEVYERFAPMVYNLCLRMSGDPVRAQDLSQEVFLRIFKGLGRFRGRSALSTWIYRVAVNCCRSRLGRRRLQTESLSQDVPESALEDPGRSPEEQVLASDSGAVVAAALLRLPARFREAVVLRDLEGLSYEEIAGVLGVRIGTVRSRIARGRERLRRVLEETS